MQYMLMVYDVEANAAKMTEEEAAANMGAWMAYSEKLGASGKMRSGEALHPTTMATTLRGVGDKPMTVDGPFAETKEQLGGYFVVEAADLDEAVLLASTMPHLAHGGSVEIRPVVDFG